MAGYPRYPHTIMGTQQENDEVGRGASAPSSNMPVHNNTGTLNGHSSAQAGHGLHPTGSFPNLDLGGAYESNPQYSSEYDGEEETDSEIDDSSKGSGYESENNVETTEGHYVVLHEGTGSGDESSEGLETDDESDSEITDTPESPSESSELGGSTSMIQPLNALAASSQQHGIPYQNLAHGHHPSLPLGASVGTVASSASGPQSNGRTRLPDSRVPTAGDVLASSEHGCGPWTSSIAMRQTGSESSQGSAKLGVAGNAASSSTRLVAGGGVNTSFSGVASPANAVMRPLTLHHRSADALVGGQQSRALLDFSFSSTGVPREIFRSLVRSSVTTGDLRTILEVHSSGVRLSDNQIPEQLKNCWYSIQHNLNVNPHFKQDLLLLLDLKMNNPTSPNGVSNAGEAMNVNHAHGSQVGGTTGGTTNVGMSFNNNNTGVEDTGNNPANAAQGAPLVANYPAIGSIVAIGAGGRQVRCTGTPDTVIADLRARAARGDYLYGDGTPDHPDVIALAQQRPLGPLPANPVRGGVRFVSAPGIVIGDGTGGGQASAVSPGGASGGVPDAPGTSSGKHVPGVPGKSTSGVKRGSQAMTGVSAGDDSANAPGIIIGGTQVGGPASTNTSSPYTLAHAPGVVIGSGTTVAVPSMYIPPMPKVKLPPVLVAGDVTFGAEYIAKGRKAASFVPPMTEAAAAAAAAATAAASAAQSPQPKKKKRASKGAVSAANNVVQPSHNLFIANSQPGSTGGHGAAGADNPSAVAAVARFENRLDGLENNLSARFDNLAAEMRQLTQAQHRGYEADFNNGAYTGFTYPEPPAPQ